MAFLEELAETYEVVAPEFPGFGASEGLEAIDDIEDASFHLLDVLDRLDFDRVDLVGLSLGGWMAAELATRWPERVRRLVLVNPVGLYIEGEPITEIFGRPLDELATELFADPDHPVAQMMRAMAGAEMNPGDIPFDLIRPVIQSQAATAKLGWKPYLHNPKLGGASAVSALRRSCPRAPRRHRPPGPCRGLCGRHPRRPAGGTRRCRPHGHLGAAGRRRRPRPSPPPDLKVGNRPRITAGRDVGGQLPDASSGSASSRPLGQGVPGQAWRT